MQKHGKVDDRFQAVPEKPVARIPAKCDRLYRGRDVPRMRSTVISGFHASFFFLVSVGALFCLSLRGRRLSC